MREIYQILFDGTYPHKKLYILPGKHGIQVKICKKILYKPRNNFSNNSSYCNNYVKLSKVD